MSQMLRRQLNRAMGEDEPDDSPWDVLDEQPPKSLLDGLVSWLQPGKAWRVCDGKLVLDKAGKPYSAVDTAGRALGFIHASATTNGGALYVAGGFTDGRGTVSKPFFGRVLAMDLDGAFIVQTRDK